MAPCLTNSPLRAPHRSQSEFKIACRSELTKAQKNALSTKVRQDYRVHMIMDNLPAATKMIAEMPDGTKKDMCVLATTARAQRMPARVPARRPAPTVREALSRHPLPC